MPRGPTVGLRTRSGHILGIAETVPGLVAVPKDASTAAVVNNQIKKVSENGYLAMEATVLVEAFEDTLKMLGLIDRDDPVRLAVARHIIIFARAGERDPVRL